MTDYERWFAADRELADARQQIATLTREREEAIARADEAVRELNRLADCVQRARSIFWSLPVSFGGDWQIETMAEAVAAEFTRRSDGMLRNAQTINEYQAEVSRQVNRADRAEAQLAEAIARAERAEQEVKRLYGRCDDYRKEIADTEAQLAEEKQAHRDTVCVGEALIREIKALTERADRAEAQLAEARREAERLRAHIENGMSVVSRAAGFISGVLDNNGGDSADDPQVIGCLRWEIEARRLLGLPPEIVDTNDESPWAKAMRAALNPPTEGQKE